MLWEILSTLMTFDELKSFRLIGGTSLSLHLGHRISVDIDMFSDAEYGSIDFASIDKLFCSTFPYVEFGLHENSSLGKSYFIGNSEDDLVKVDLFYTDTFVFPGLESDGLRLSSLEEIAAMKLEVIGHGGRKKDFWDLHELMNFFSFPEMLGFYAKRYPYGYSKELLVNQILAFSEADFDFEPICLKSKYWELVKIDIEDKLRNDFFPQT